MGLSSERWLNKESDEINNNYPDYRNTKAFEEKSSKDIKRIDSFQSWVDYSSSELDRMLLDNQESKGIS